jgi:hypothetical protein
VNHVDPPAGASFDFSPDGAYWLSDVEVRDVPRSDGAAGRPADHVKGVVDAVSQAIPAPAQVPLFETGVASPLGHSTPYVRSGVTLVDAPPGAPLDLVVANRLVLDLTNVAAVTGGDAVVRRDGDDVIVEVTDAGNLTIRAGA